MTSCEWCGVDFQRKSEKGPAPRFCSAAHRQRSYEARNIQKAQVQLNNFAKLAASPEFGRMVETLRLASVPTATMQARLAETMRNAVAPTAAMRAQLAETMRMAVAPAVAMQAQLAETMRMAVAPTVAAQARLAETTWMATVPLAGMQERVAEILRLAVAPLAGQGAALSAVMARAMELYRRINPPNWPEDVSMSEMFDLITDTGWALTYVPRSEVILELLGADSADRDSVLVAYAEDIAVDCRVCLTEITDPELAHLVAAVGQALDAFDAGLSIPAQATVASVLGDIVSRTFELTFAAAVRELSEDPGEMPLPYVRFWLVASTIPRALSRFHCETGDPVPDRFNRHATAHTVDPRQYTKLNALVGLMMVTSLVRQIAEDLKDDENGDPPRTPTRAR